MCSASLRSGFIRSRSSWIPSSAERFGASGCGRRVSLNRRTSTSSDASRKISTGCRFRIAFQAAEDLRHLLEHLPFAHVDDDRRAGDLVPGAQRQLREHRQQRDRQVVDAEVPEILQRADRL